MSVLSPALLGAVGLVLLAAAVGHLRSPAELREGLRAHGILPTGLQSRIAGVLGPLEAVLGVAALVVAVSDVPSGVSLAVGMPIAGLFLSFTVYLWRVLKVTEGQVVPCACGLGQTPVSESAVVRGGILTALAITGAVSGSAWSLAAAPPQEVFVAVAGMLVIALAVALLPAARALPEATIRAGARGHHHGHGSAHQQDRYENAGRTSETPTFIGEEGR